jgi:hypothetical protein
MTGKGAEDFKRIDITKDDRSDTAALKTMLML